MIFLFFSRATPTLGMAVDVSVSISEDKDLNPELTHLFNASGFVHYEVITQDLDLDLDLNDLENGSSDNGDSENDKNDDFTPALSRRGVVPPLLVCETSGGSPWTKDIYDLADWMVNAKLQPVGDCKQKNPVRSRCNRVQWSGSAEAALCGRLGLSVSCKTLGEGARAVAKYCTRGGRAGGRLIWDTLGASLIVYNIEKL
ncbi:hypothetical protein DFP73DRAFT_590473 [Morchella snyderi]|nr:hypothetical protein DFP73DRAFT_590473 [Morchella snyderi]